MSKRTILNGKKGIYFSASWSCSPWVSPAVAPSVVAGQKGVSVLRPDDPAVPIAEAWDKYSEAFERKDYATAIPLLRKAAELRDKANLSGPAANFYTTMIGLSEFLVGNLFERGDGVPQDFAIAKEWYKKAADHGSEAGKAGLAKLQEPAIETAHSINLICGLPLVNGKTQKAIVYIDIASKSLKIDGFDQGIYEYRDGVYGKVIKTGFRAGDAVNQHQFVTIDENQVRFGARNDQNKIVSDNNINRRTLLLTISGLYKTVNECSLAKRRF